MQFKTKDLLVSVLPKAATTVQDLDKICALHTLICRYPTLCAAPTRVCFGCTIVISHPCTCTHLASIPAVEGPDIVFGPHPEPWVIRDSEDLAGVRKELQDTLAKLDAMEREGLPGNITTRAEAEALETGLKAALEQVAAQKKNLK